MQGVLYPLQPGLRLGEMKEPEAMTRAAEDPVACQARMASRWVGSVASGGL